MQVIDIQTNKPKRVVISEDRTHVPREFLSEHEIELLEKEGSCVRCEPICHGGRIFKLRKGGMYYATMQQITYA
jgi:hypothetical protein